MQFTVQHHRIGIAGDRRVKQENVLVAPFGEGEVLPMALPLVPNEQHRLSKSAGLFMEWLSREMPLTRQAEIALQRRRTGE